MFRLEDVRDAGLGFRAFGFRAVQGFLGFSG